VNDRPRYLEAFLVSAAALLLEVGYTRVLSFKLVYYFTYVVIGIALLGLGTGAGWVALRTAALRGQIDRIVTRACALGAFGVVGGYAVVAFLPINLFLLVGQRAETGQRLAEGGKLLLLCTSLLVPFLGIGIALALIFSVGRAAIARLYFADLLGAALAAAICVPLLRALTAPGTIMLGGVLLALAGLRAAAGSGRAVAALGGAALIAAAGALAPRVLPEPVLDGIKVRVDGASVSRWDPVFRLDVVPVSDPTFVFLVHDGTIGSSVRRWDGRIESLGHYDGENRSLPFRMLGAAPSVVVIGSAGGNELLATLHFGASRVIGVELNASTVDVLRHDLAEFSGRLADHDRLTLVNAEGRSFLASSPDRYDLIWLVAPDSYAAMNAATSGAFVLSESYLYTREMIREALDHLTDDGILCAQFGEFDVRGRANRTTRYVGTTRAALGSLGIDNVARHVLVGSAPSFGTLEESTVLVRKRPFTAEELRRFREATAAVTGARVLFDWEHPGTGPIATVLTAPHAALAAWYRAHPWDVTPVTDDAPFFWHFTRFGDVARSAVPLDPNNLEEGIGERLLLSLLVIVVLAAAAVLAVPFLGQRSVWRSIPYKGRAAVYFAALGLGFMAIEVSLIQRLTLFLGYPTYSLTITVAGLLLSTGIGSMASERWGAARPALLVSLGATLAVLVGGGGVWLSALVQTGVGWPLAWRVAAVLGMLFPLGLVLGVFMPLGLRTVAQSTEHGDHFVAWAWAVNGFFSVVSSVGTTLVSMVIGFNAVMWIGLAIYLVALAALACIPGRAEASGKGRSSRGEG
jgi:hypothetical protein